MIKNSLFDVYDSMDKKTLETMALAFECDFVATTPVDEGREFIKARLGIIYGLLKYKFK